MTVEQWQKLESLYHAALELDVAKRSAFIADACSDDAALQQEIESLLTHEPEAAEFLETVEPLSPRPNELPEHPAPFFKLFVWFVAFLSIGAFAYGAWLLASDDPKSVGWTNGGQRGAQYVTSVDPKGPAAGSLQIGDRLIAINGDRRIVPALRAFQRNSRAGDSYRVAISRGGSEKEFTLSSVPGPSFLANRLNWFVISFIWCAIGLYMGYARPGHPVARLAFLSAMATGLVFLWVGLINLWPLWQPLHAVLGYHFFLRFPAGVKTSRVWRMWLYLLYATGGTSAAITQIRVLYRTFSGAGFFGRHPMIASVESTLGMFAFAAAIVGMLAVIWRNYRVLSDEDQRRRVRWVAMGSFIALIPQLWWTAVSLYDSAFGPSGVSRFDFFVNGATLAIPITVAYAVIQHHVFDVKTVLRRGVEYLLARRALQVAILLPAIVAAINIAKNRNRTIAELVRGDTGYLYWIVAAALTLRYRGRIHAWLDRNFFREEYVTEQVLVQLMDDLQDVESLPELSRRIASQLDSTLHPKSLYFWYRADDVLMLTYPTEELFLPLQFPSDGDLLSHLELHQATLEVPLKTGMTLTSLEAAWLDTLGVRLIVPVIDAENRLAGVWALGERKSELPYSDRDRRLLEALARQAAVVRENLRLRTEVREEHRVRRDVLSRLDRESYNLLKECPSCGTCFDNKVECCEHDGNRLTVTLPIERTIQDKYRLNCLIGRGGMGAVYEAQDLRLERTVAVKIMIGETFGQRNALRRFHREARAAARLNHPNIVSVYDFGQLHGDGAFLVMERIYGLTLRAKLLRDGILSPAAVIDWFGPLLDGLAAAHEAGIVHCDLKPENIIGEERNGSLIAVKILDFGLAKVRMTEPAMTNSTTLSGFIAGTIGYMSPERIAGETVDQRCDIYAIGVMVVEALTGQLPRAEELKDSLTQIQPVNQIVRHCLARDPHERYASAAVLRKELIAALHSRF